MHWWYLLPITLAMLAFLGHSSWRNRAIGWAAVLLFLVVAVLGLAVFTWIYSINQVAVRTDLEPRRQ